MSAASDRAVTTAGAGQAPEPLRVVSGNMTDEEVVALVTALAAAATTRAGIPQAGAPSRWADRAALLGVAPSAGPGAWAASAWRR